MQQANLHTTGVHGILIRARVYNNDIGQYQQHIINNGFNFSVRLDNGTIEIPYSMAQDQEVMPSSISEERIQRIANSFKSKNTKPSSSPNNSNLKNEVLPKAKKSFWEWFLGLFR